MGEYGGGGVRELNENFEMIYLCEVVVKILGVKWKLDLICVVKKKNNYKNRNDKK